MTPGQLFEAFTEASVRRDAAALVDLFIRVPAGSQTRLAKAVSSEGTSRSTAIQSRVPDLACQSRRNG